MTDKFTIMKFIEIDAAHRVPEHGSGCRNLHGHRYKVEAHCTGALASVGEQSGMTLDFKFLKEELMAHIHDPCDHGMILRVDDFILKQVALEAAGLACDHICGSGFKWFEHQQDAVKLYIIPVVPTAENLAAHWFWRLKDRVHVRSEGRAVLSKIRVWETPTCFADYPSL